MEEKQSDLVARLVADLHAERRERQRLERMVTQLHAFIGCLEELNKIAVEGWEDSYREASRFAPELPPSTNGVRLAS